MGGLHGSWEKGRYGELEVDFDVNHSRMLFQYRHAQTVFILSATPGKMSKEKFIMRIEEMDKQQFSTQKRIS